MLLYSKAYVLIQLKQFEEALDIANIVLAKNPEH